MAKGLIVLESKIQFLNVLDGLIFRFASLFLASRFIKFFLIAKINEKGQSLSGVAYLR
jgi:hypothetical protein